MASFGAHGPSAGAAAGAGARFGDAEGYVVPLLDVATPVEVRWLARPAGITKAACDGAASGVHEYLSRIGDGIDSGDATAVGGASRHRHDMDDKRAERLAQALRVSPGGFNSYSVVAILAHPHDPRCRILPRGWDSFALQATAASGEIFLLMGAKPAEWEVSNNRGRGGGARSGDSNKQASCSCPAYHNSVATLTLLTLIALFVCLGVGVFQFSVVCT